MLELNTKTTIKRSTTDASDRAKQLVIEKYTNSDIAYCRSTLIKLKEIISLEAKLRHHHIKVIERESLEAIRPKIYTCTTGGANDLHTVFSLLTEPAWLPVIKPQHPTAFETYLSRHHLITWYEACNKKMCQILFDRQIKLLQSGASIICFPELTPSQNPQTISKLNIDYADLVKETEALIIPIGIVETTKEASTNIFVTIGHPLASTSLKTNNRENIITMISEELENLKKTCYEEAHKTEHELKFSKPSSRHLLIKRKCRK